MKGGGEKTEKVIGRKIVPHKYEGVFVAYGTIGDDRIFTKSLVPRGLDHHVDNREEERRIWLQNEDGVEVEYLEWCPFASMVAAAVRAMVDNIWIAPGSKVLYIGAACLQSVSHVSDVVGHNGVVYAVEVCSQHAKGFMRMAKKRKNVVPIVNNATRPTTYSAQLEMVDVIVSDVPQPDQARILAMNASHFLKEGGHFLMFVKAACVDSTIPAEAVFDEVVKKLRSEDFTPVGETTLEPFETDSACIMGGYRIPKERKVDSIT